jgi:hypothetical protein
MQIVRYVEVATGAAAESNQGCCKIEIKKGREKNLRPMSGPHSEASRVNEFCATVLKWNATKTWFYYAGIVP